MADASLPPPSLDAALRRGVRAADAWSAHALADLAWCDADRPSDELRAATRTRWRSTLRSAAERLAEPLGWADHADPALAVLDEAGWSTPARMAPALTAARHRLLRAGLLRAARPFGVTDPLDELSAKTGRTGALARDVLALREDQEVVPSAEAWHELCWAVAAALRVVALREGDSASQQDAALRASVAATLASHDEAADPGTVARRLARRLAPDRLMPGEALLAGHTHLAAALLGERVAVPVDRLSDWLLAPDPMPFAVALRAGGEDAAGIGGLMAALAGARGQPVAALAERIATLHDLSVEAASERLAEWTT